MECLGSTILHVDAGIDTGDIITHVKPKIEIGDDVHTIGCKIIRESVSKIKEILNLIEKGDEINRVKQWEINDEKIYRLKDFDEGVLKKYLQNIDDGIVEKYVNNEKKEVKIIDEIKNNN